MRNRENSVGGRIIALAPCLNEAQAIPKVVKKLLPFVGTVLVIDDGSSDGTGKAAERAGATVLRHKKNKGVGAAIRTGIRYAQTKHFSICIVLGGDDQDDPQQIPLLLQKLSEGYDFVQGSRYVRGGKTVDIPLFRWITTHAYSIFLSLILGKRITDGTNGFRAFRLDICKDTRINLNQHWLDKYELEPYLLYKAIRLGYKVTEVPVTKAYPKEGYTKMDPLTDYWSILRPLIFLRLGIKK